MVHTRTVGYAESRGQRMARAALLLLCATAIILTVPARAQSEVDKGAVLRELDRTDQIILQAQEMTAEANALSARGHLDLAIRIQGKARGEFRQARYGQAYSLTQRARREALKALDTSRAERKTLESIDRLLEKANERAAEVSEWVRESNDPQASQVLEQGIEQLRRARRANRDRHYAQATRMGNLAVSLIERAGRLARDEVSSAATAAASIERSAALIERVQAALADQGGGTPRQAAVLADARDLLRRAQGHLDEGHVQLALRLSLSARQLGLQILGEITQEPAQRDLREALDDLHALYAELGPEIEATGGRQALRMLNEGRQFLRRARKLLSEGSGREALQHMLAAERMLKQAAKTAGL